MIIYFIGTSYERSGVYTLGFQLATEFPDEVFLVLFDSVFTHAKKAQVLSLPIEQSHLPDVIVSSILTSRTEWPSRIIILPNNTECGYEVARELQLRLSRLGSHSSIVGVVHANTVSSIALVIKNRFMLDRVYSVSENIHSSLVAGTNPELHSNVLLCPISGLVGAPSERDLIVENGPLRLIFVGRIVEDQKRFSRVLVLIDQLRKKRIQFKLSVIGSGHLMQALTESRLHDSNQESDLLILGELSHARVLHEMSSSHVLILTSEFEGSPLVVMEAMSVGAVPVVMNYGPEVAELITHGENGYVVEQARVDEMADMLELLANDRKKLRELSNNALARASEFMSFNAWRDEICRPTPKRLIRNDPRKSSYVETWERITRGVKKIQADNKVLIWGGGHIGRLLVGELISNNHQVDGCVVVDRVLHKYLSRYRDVPFYSSEKLPEEKFDVAIVASEYYAAEIQATLEDLKRKHNPTLHITAVRDWR